jgi:hypothetical protein
MRKRVAKLGTQDVSAERCDRAQLLPFAAAMRHAVPGGSPVDEPSWRSRSGHLADRQPHYANAVQPRPAPASPAGQDRHLIRSRGPIPRCRVAPHAPISRCARAGPPASLHPAPATPGEQTRCCSGGATTPIPLGAAAVLARRAAGTPESTRICRSQRSELRRSLAAPSAAWRSVRWSFIRIGARLGLAGRTFLSAPRAGWERSWRSLRRCRSSVPRR